MDISLDELIDLARKHTITPEEHQAQLRSFAYGNTHLANDTITREQVDSIASSLFRQPKPSDTVS